MTDVLIAGCGYIGTRLGLRLSADGHRVWGLRRRAEHLPREIIPLARDLGQAFSLAAVPAPRVVFYVAAAGARDEAAYRRTYLDGPAHLLAALADLERQPERLIFASCTSGYGQSAGEWVDETLPAQPDSFAGKILLQAERRLAASPIAAIVVRFSGIYGPGRDWLLRLARSGTTCPSEPPRYSNRIHAEDAAAVLAQLAAIAEPAPVYLASDCLPAPLHEVLAWSREQLAAAGVPCDREGQSMPSRSNKRCRNDRLLAAGFHFRYPDYRSGYADLISQWARTIRG